MANLPGPCPICNSTTWCERPCNPGIAAGLVMEDGRPGPAAKPAPPPAPEPAAEPSPSGPSTTYKYRDPEKRRAYMRAYKKRQRAKAREERERLKVAGRDK